MVLRIFKIIATSGFLAASECTKFVFGLGSARTPAGELTALPNPLAGLATSKGRKRERGKKKRRKRKRTGGTALPLSQIPGSALIGAHQGNGERGPLLKKFSELYDLPSFRRTLSVAFGTRKIVLMLTQNPSFNSKNFILQLHKSVFKHVLLADQINE